MNSKKPFIITLIVSAVVVTILAFLIHDLNKTQKKNESQIKALENTLSHEGVIIKNVSKTRDSLLKRVNYFQQYGSLVDATFFRDSTAKSLKYKAGDVVLLKPDSAKVVIKEIIIGGTQYEHYIKYKVVMKDRSQLEVTPEMLY